MGAARTVKGGEVEEGCDGGRGGGDGRRECGGEGVQVGFHEPGEGFEVDNV